MTIVGTSIIIEKGVIRCTFNLRHFNWPDPSKDTEVLSCEHSWDEVSPPERNKFYSFTPDDLSQQSANTTAVIHHLIFYRFSTFGVTRFLLF
jgi:hypothetical protein